MAEQPILFNGAMVRAILDGRKTQTRRVVKGAAEFADMASELQEHRELAGWQEHIPGHLVAPCPFGKPGDRLWVRETWMPGYYHEADHEDGPKVSVIHRADNAESTVAAPSYELAEEWEREFSEDGDEAPPWRPSIHMPRWACRIVLEITGVRVERLNAISDAACWAEGAIIEKRPDQFSVHSVIGVDGRAYLSPRRSFHALWTSTGGDWDANPWVWVIEFKRMEASHG